MEIALTAGVAIGGVMAVFAPVQAAIDVLKEVSIYVPVFSI